MSKKWIICRSRYVEDDQLGSTGGKYEMINVVLLLLRTNSLKMICTFKIKDKFTNIVDQVFTE